MTILKEKGIFCFICSNKFAKAKYGEKLRKFILNNQLKIYNDFTGIKVFKEASVDTCVIQIKKDFIEDNEVFVNDEYFMTQNKLHSNSFTFNSPEILNLRDKIFNQGTMIKDLNIQINYGIKTGFNDAFIIDEKTKNRLIKEDSNNKEIIKPLLRGRDINKWKIISKNLYLIYCPWNFKINNYPSIKSHLNNYKEKLSERPEVKNGRYKWYCMSRYAADYVDLFEKEKIVYSTIAPEPRFAYDNRKHFMLDSGFILTCDSINIKYLIALLNSDILFWYFKDICYSLNTKGFQYKKIFVDQLPIVINNQYETQIIKKVDDIINLTNELLKKENQFFNHLKNDFFIFNYSKKLEEFYVLTENEFLKEISKKNKNYEKRNLLEFFLKARNEISIIKSDLKIKNEELNEIIYKIYNLNEKEIKIIQDDLI